MHFRSAYPCTTPRKSSGKSFRPSSAISDCASRENFRGWVFRVAHNLALKQRYANQRSRDKAASDWSEGRFDPSPDPEEQSVVGSKTQPPSGRCSCSPERGSGLPPAPCPGSPLPGNSGGTRHVLRSGIDIADTVASTVDPCAREIELC
jgi:hypothetical protein